ncbi:hypothetical protein SAMN02745225_00256 [Ferrithrix thermotolerans DSM 19514]|uniref:Uncharacterized protein n=1 Tax=Ferrithrix thermotolerans DSM 19514 TaxID=1121881 RepID=A0A1M4SFI4_9ACTN|nr:hypothetical protein SAMN02745225_00256 [Ferrithrix thermotolerans DSM 19514]
MQISNLIRDAIELLFVVAIAGMIGSILKRITRGGVHVYLCPTCSRPTSRAYPRCRHCNSGLP